MRFEWRTTLGASLFLGVICAIYWFWSTEDAGTAMLLFSFAAYLIIASWIVLQWRRRKKIPRPEDRDDGSYEETADAELGYFPAVSIWPVAIGLGATMVGIALIFGNWYWVPALGLLIGAIVGYAVEAEAPEDPPSSALEAAHRTDSSALPGQGGEEGETAEHLGSHTR